MTAAAVELRDSSSDKDIVRLAKKVISDTAAFLQSSKKRIDALSKATAS